MNDMQKIAVLALSDFPNRAEIVREFKIALDSPDTKLNRAGGSPMPVEPTPASIINSIHWETTPQGHNYWSAIHRTL